MVNSGNLTAKNIVFESNNTQEPVANAVGITVQSGASLDLNGATLKVTSNRSAYGVYAQAGSGEVSINNTKFELTAAEGRNNIAIGLETGSYDNLTKSGNTISENAYELSFHLPEGNFDAAVQDMKSVLSAGKRGFLWGAAVTGEGSENGQFVVVK